MKYKQLFLNKWKALKEFLRPFLPPKGYGGWAIITLPPASQNEQYKEMLEKAIQLMDDGYYVVINETPEPGHCLSCGQLLPGYTAPPTRSEPVESTRSEPVEL